MISFRVEVATVLKMTASNLKDISSELVKETKLKKC